MFSLELHKDYTTNMLKDKLKTYKVVADESDIYAMSVVECPANEQSFVMFSKDDAKKQIVCFESDLKHNIMGVALIPDQKIYRNYDGEEFYITFDADTIEKLAHKFLKTGGNMYMTKDHLDYAEGLSVAESWIKTSENDKSVDFGIEAPIGSWIITCHCDSIDLWESFKEGKRTGFSIESFVQLEEIVENKDKKENDMSKQKTNLETMEVNDGFWDKLKGIIAEALGTSKDDEVVEEAVEEAKQEADPVEEVVEAEEETPEVPVEEVAEEVIDTIEEGAETTEEATEDLQAVVDSLQEEIDALKAENEELKKANQKMSKKPSAKVNVKQSAEKSNPRDVIEALYNGSYFKK